MNKKIEIQKITIYKDSEGIENKSWISIRECWAKTEDKIVRSINENSQSSSKIETNFIIRKNNYSYNNKNRIIHNKTIYKIIDIMDQKEYLKIITESDLNGN